MLTLNIGVPSQYSFDVLLSTGLSEGGEEISRWVSQGLRADFIVHYSKRKLTGILESRFRGCLATPYQHAE
jgi:hypothetical protein